MNDYLLTLKPRHRRDYVRLASAAVALVLCIVVLLIPVHLMMNGTRVDCGTPLRHWFNDAHRFAECGRPLNGHVVRAAALLFSAIFLTVAPIFAGPLLRLGIVVLAVVAVATFSNGFNASGSVIDLFVAVVPIATVVYLAKRLHADD